MGRHSINCQCQRCRERRRAPISFVEWDPAWWKRTEGLLVEPDPVVIVAGPFRRDGEEHYLVNCEGKEDHYFVPLSQLSRRMVNRGAG